MGLSRDYDVRQKSSICATPALWAHNPRIVPINTKDSDAISGIKQAYVVRKNIVQIQDLFKPEKSLHETANILI